MNEKDIARSERTAAMPAQHGPAGETVSTTLMLLRLGTRWFGVDVRAIEEVALKGEVTRVPKAPSHILGVTSLRGRLVTVVGLQQMIGGHGMLSRESPATPPRLVVVRDGEYEMAVVAELFGTPPDVIPPSLEDFQSYFAAQIAGDRIAVTAPAREIAGVILRTPLPGPMRLLAPANRLATAAQLPPRLREEYGLRLPPAHGPLLSAAGFSVKFGSRPILQIAGRARMVRATTLA